MQSPGLKIIHVAILGLVAALAYLGWMLFINPPPRDDIKSYCISNLKQLGTEMQAYLADFDERFPPKTWHLKLGPYTKNEDLFTCPKVNQSKQKWGYAMNIDLRGIDSRRVQDPSTQPMLFEIDTLAADAYAKIGSRSVGRHKSSSGKGMGSNVGRMDTSVRFLPADVQVLSEIHR